MAGHFAFEEDAVADKLKTGVWLRVISYAFRYWYLLLGLFATVIITSLYDSALVPLMNKAAIKALQVNAASLGGNILDLDIVVTFFCTSTFPINFIENWINLFLKKPLSNICLFDFLLSSPIIQFFFILPNNLEYVRIQFHVKQCHNYST